MPSTMIPVIVGVVDVRNRSTRIKDAKEPAHLMFEAIKIALFDAQYPQATPHILKSSFDAVSVVRTWTRP
ncbi:uncharacterized protein ACLA_099360 [Aspergillus clavatus NRRL 1]|uniref:Uncharacterized protein n=1 Tax=Aspergillus clavatus (strain ATCC 1007 / CBS 513.65 / DSM 816 / NCTC 3887 / NRRL 1 / QM 1276 / 107) TaxID=344612 RepID=A1CN54_ASPCL|nr:uncharacterized protein ACLA_099360 [Aspergillus clavatus NRRL 1]EAW08991.1 hypothetical protein ACLA_099360 [Aspergillus clavatus NRRL 1]